MSVVLTLSVNRCSETKRPKFFAIGVPVRTYISPRLNAIHLARHLLTIEVRPKTYPQMKTHVLLLALLVSTTAHGITIAQWTFENNTPADLANSMTIGGISADAGAGTASGRHASSATDWTTPAGNGSANALSVNTWAVGDYFQFQVSGSGYQGLSVSWHQTRSSTGPGTFDLAYSLDGSTFTVVLNNYTVSSTTWSASGSPNSASAFNQDLSSILVLNNASTIYFRLIADAAPTDAGGASRIDNFTVNGNAQAALPESGPGFWGWTAISGLLAFGWRVRRQDAVRSSVVHACVSKPSHLRQP